MQKQVAEFLHKTGMHFDTIDLKQNLDEFVDEMRRGLEGRESSLMMLPTYLQVSSEVPLNQRIVVMDAGGTNFRVATVTFTAEGPVIEHFQKYAMPGTQGRVSREQFFDTIADYLAPVAEYSDKVGFCFSFPTEIQPNRDGKMLHFSKEVYVDDVEGELVGEGINQALVKRGMAPKSFVLLNDTVATMLGGVASRMDDAFDGHIGYILGTGTNTCYMERCANVTKSLDALLMDGQMAINVESGNYAKFPRGTIDRELDAATGSPGRYAFEKMMSGYYQGTLIYRTVAAAAEEGLFSLGFVTSLGGFSDFTMYEIDQFCFRPFGENPLAGLCQSEEDRLVLYDIIDASFERAARLTAINFGAILVHTGTGTSPIRPVCVTAEGTTFYKSKLFRGKLDYYVRTFLNDELGVYCEFNRAEDVTLIGTAVAGLLN